MIILPKPIIDWRELYIALGLDMEVYEQINSGKEPAFAKLQVEQGKGAASS